MNKKSMALLTVLGMVFLEGCTKEKDDTLTIGMKLQYSPFEVTDSKII